MALVTRYFSTSSAGAGDGTTWADRAALLSAGAFNTIISGFAFTAGSDGLLVVIGPGTYTVTTALAFSAGSPTISKPCMFHGCDSSGNLLTPPDPDWTSDMTAWDSSGLPVIATTGDVAALSGLNAYSALRLIRMTSSGWTTSTRTFCTYATCDWCTFENSSGSWSTSGDALVTYRITNSVIKQTGSTFRACLTLPYPSCYADNVRIEGVTGSSGNRNGIQVRPSTNDDGAVITRCTVFGVNGIGLELDTTAGTNVRISAYRNTIVNCGGSGIRCIETGSPGYPYLVDSNCVTGCGGYGVENTGTVSIVSNNRLRDNTSGNIEGFGNYPDLGNNYVTDSDDSTEYNSPGSSNYDYRIKSGLAWSGRGIGVSEMAASSGGSSPRFGDRTGGLR